MGNAGEARLVEGIEVLALGSLTDLARLARGELLEEAPQKRPRRAPAAA